MPFESSFISPKDEYTFPSCSDTVLKELSMRSVSVAESFSSTVARICSSFSALVRCISLTAFLSSTVCLRADSERSLRISATDFIRLVCCSVLNAVSSDSR